MSRLQLALNVSDLDAAIEHYSTLFGTSPAKIKHGYANFAIAQPPLKLVLIQNDQAEHGSINHLGVEVESRDEVAAEHARVTGAGLAAMVEGETTCCYAVQDKFWVEGGPTQFEIYTVLAPAEVMHETESSCCASDDVAAPTDAEPVAAGRCC